MSDLAWWADSPPWIHVVASNSPVLAERALPPTGSILAARMQGRQMLDADGVFTQFYEHLRLPDYFGWNWNALYDCLSDLNWLAATHYLLIVDDSESILSGSPEERPVFFRTLLRSAEDWAGKPEFPGRQKTTFRVVLLCDPEARDALGREIAHAQDLM